MTNPGRILEIGLKKLLKRLNAVSFADEMNHTDIARSRLGIHPAMRILTAQHKSPPSWLHPPKRPLARSPGTDNGQDSVRFAIYSQGSIVQRVSARKSAYLSKY